MLIYRFKLYTVEHEEFTLEIEIQPGQSFRDFHECIIESSELLPPDKAFFYPTDKKNKKSTEISLKSYKKQEKKYDPELDEMVMVTSAPRLMKDCKIKNYIEDPHQRMIYEYYGKSAFTYMIELFRIVQSDGNTLYPHCVRKTGELPKLTMPIPIPEPPKPEAEKPAAPKVALPSLDTLAKFDDLIENEDELSKIEEGIGELLGEEGPLELEIEGEASPGSGEESDETLSMFGAEEEEEEATMEHLEDFDDIENIEMNYSRYESDPDDH